MVELESTVVDETTVGFGDLAARVAAETAEEHAKLDVIFGDADLPPVVKSRVRSRARLLRRLRGRAA